MRTAIALPIGTVLLGASAILPAPISQERIAEIVANPDRRPADRTNDLRRKPAEMLAFIGVRPGMVALDLSAGGGYTTELIARAVGPAGRVYGQSRPGGPNSPAPTPPAPEGGAAASTAPPKPPAPPNSPRALVEREKNPAAANIVAVVRRFEDPVPPELAANGLDLVTLMFNCHDFGWLEIDRDQMNRAVFAALKPGGIYVIADHSGRPRTGISESGTLHRIEEAFLRSPNDPRDKNTPVPAQPKDEFVLKFVKP